MSAAVDELVRALRYCSTKREAAERLGCSAAGVRSRIETARPELLDLWRAMPAGGAFAGRGRLPAPGPTRTQDAADLLVARALEAAPPLSAGRNQRENVVPLMCAMVERCGGFGWPRGWVRSVMVAFEDAGLPSPPSTVLRWFRSRLATDPECFLCVAGVDHGLLTEVAALAYR